MGAIGLFLQFGEGCRGERKRDGRKEREAPCSRERERLTREGGGRCGQIVKAMGTGLISWCGRRQGNGERGRKWRVNCRRFSANVMRRRKESQNGVGGGKANRRREKAAASSSKQECAWAARFSSVICEYMYEKGTTN